MRFPRRLVPAVAVVSFGALALTGCVAEEAPTPTETVSTAAPSAPAPSPTEAEVAPEETEQAFAPLVIPTCDQLVSLELLKEQIGAEVEVLADPVPGMDAMIDPTVQATLDGAVDTTTCAWGVPFSDGMSIVSVTELGAENNVTLLTALRANTTLQETPLGDAAAFSREDDMELGFVAVTYAVLDNAFVTVYGSGDILGSQAIAAEALAQLAAVNDSMS